MLFDLRFSPQYPVGPPLPIAPFLPEEGTGGGWAAGGMRGRGELPGLPLCIH